MTSVRQRFTLLGCGSSPGVPRISGDWGACDPAEPRNRRARASLLVEQFGADGNATTVVIDTGPDFRDQMIRAAVKRLDAAVYTHPHADHIHGIDDLRGYVIVQRRRIPVYADMPTMARLREGFGYCFETPEGSEYPPILTPHLLEGPGHSLAIDGAGGRISLLPFEQYHGSIVSLGFRIGNVAYCSDVSGFPAETVERLQDLEVLIIDALQYRRHPSHFSIGQALEWIERLQPKRAILTHMHIPLDYNTVQNGTPDHIEPGYDMMTFEQTMEVSA